MWLSTTVVISFSLLCRCLMKTCKIYLLIYVKGKATERRKDIFHLLTHSPNNHNSQELRAGLPLSGRTWPSSWGFLGTLAGTWIVSRAAGLAPAPWYCGSTILAHCLTFHPIPLKILFFNLFDLLVHSHNACDGQGPKDRNLELNPGVPCELQRSSLHELSLLPSKFFISRKMESGARNQIRVFPYRVLQFCFLVGGSIDFC